MGHSFFNDFLIKLKIFDQCDFALVLFCSPCKGSFCGALCFQKGLFKQRIDIVQDVRSSSSKVLAAFTIEYATVQKSLIRNFYMWTSFLLSLFYKLYWLVNNS